jgi:tetrahydromethanopterin S-methyltransferase subunit C
MGFGVLAGILAGLMFVAMNRSVSPEGTNTALFQFGWIFYGGFIGIAIGIAQQRAAKGLLSLILGLTGGLSAALIAGLASGFPSVENLAAVPYCLLCGAVIGAFIGIADGFYEMSFPYTARCLAWGALGGILSIAAFVVLRLVFSPFWKPYLDWIVMGGVLGFFVNMCIGSAEKPLDKSPKVFREL